MDLEELAQLGDEYNATRNQRLALNREAKQLQEQETALKHKIIYALKAGNSRVIGGQTCSLELKVQREPSVEDWDLVRKFIVENDAWDCMNKALNAKGVKLRAEDNIVVPGVAWYPVEKLSIHQLKSE